MFKLSKLEVILGYGIKCPVCCKIINQQYATNATRYYTLNLELIPSRIYGTTGNINGLIGFFIER